MPIIQFYFLLITSSIWILQHWYKWMYYQVNERTLIKNIFQNIIRTSREYDISRCDTEFGILRTQWKKKKQIFFAIFHCHIDFWYLMNFREVYDVFPFKDTSSKLQIITCFLFLVKFFNYGKRNHKNIQIEKKGTYFEIGKNTASPNHWHIF